MALLMAVGRLTALYSVASIICDVEVYSLRRSIICYKTSDELIVVNIRELPKQALRGPPASCRNQPQASGLFWD